jgi:hypothetical protein
MRRYTRFFRLPDDIGTLLSSHPYADSLRRGKMWKSEDARREAAYLDDLFHVAVGQGFANAWRPQDYPAITLASYDAAQGRVIGHGQRKKYGAERDLTAPEDWPWHADGRWYPSLDWYIKTVRPRVAPQHETEDAKLFLQWNGKPYYSTTFRNFLSQGIHAVLGPKAPGPHGLRRACATWRYRHGMKLADVAAFIGDTPTVTERSYIDHGWIARVGRLTEREGIRPAPIVRANGNRTLFGEQEAEKKGLMGSVSSERKGAPVGLCKPVTASRDPTGAPQSLAENECSEGSSDSEDEPPSFDPFAQREPRIGSRAHVETSLPRSGRGFGACPGPRREARAARAGFLASRGTVKPSQDAPGSRRRVAATGAVRTGTPGPRRSPSPVELHRFGGGPGVPTMQHDLAPQRQPSTTPTLTWSVLA